MKTNKFFLLLAMIFTLAFSANAQLGYDLFGGSRVANFIPPQTLVAGTTFITNTIDMGMLEGKASLLLYANTNGATGGTLTATLYSSNDKTNFTAVSTYALATASTIVTTNRYYGGTNLTSSTSYLVPGVWTTPTVATGGWATPYLAPALFTNSAAITLSNPSVANIGLSTADLGRYLHVVYTTGGTVTNFTVGGFLVTPIRSSQLQ